MEVRNPSVVGIIQARMGSSRLPGKVLKDLCGLPLLVREVKRVRRAQSLGRVIVATTTSADDDLLVRTCRAYGIPYFRGDPLDVLDRYYQAAKFFDAEVIVRLTGDCPLIDPKEIDRTVAEFFAANADFAANRLPPPWKRTTPIGMDTEVANFAALERAWEKAAAKHDREHVMPYLYEIEGRFKTALVDHVPDWGNYRLTVDTPEDLKLIREIYNRFGGTDDFSLEDIIDVLKKEPGLLAINAHTQHKDYRETDTRFTQRETTE